MEIIANFTYYSQLKPLQIELKFILEIRLNNSTYKKITVLPLLRSQAIVQIRIIAFDEIQMNRLEKVLLAKLCMENRYKTISLNQRTLLGIDYDSSTLLLKLTQCLKVT